MKFLAVHPNFELYGSDRAFASALLAIEQRLPAWRTTVLLPERGPLLDLPIFGRVRVLIEDFWVARRRDLKPARLLGFLVRGMREVARARRRMAAYDLVYIDTIVCLDHILAARSARAPVVIHVHEIPLGTEMRVFRRMLIWSRASIIFNSLATRDAFTLPAAIRQFVVYNGAAGPAARVVREADPAEPLRILVIGRISFWKGQEVLVDAIGGMDPAQRARIEVRIVGSVFGDQTAIQDDLEARIRAFGLESAVTLHPFTADPDEHYRWADVVVVPSTRPEPFGRVAIEGMA